MARWDWYQNESTVWIEVFVAVKDYSHSVKLTGQKVHLCLNGPASEEIDWNLHAPVKELSEVKLFERKLSLAMAKQNPGLWPTLEGPNAETANQVESEQKVVVETKPPAYPTSARQPRDWGRLEAELAEEEEEDSEQAGKDDLDHFFKKIYANASEDAKRAMNKSFVESQGTVLSTNWAELIKDQ